MPPPLCSHCGTGAYHLCNTPHGVWFRTVFKCSDEPVYFGYARLLIQILSINLACARTRSAALCIRLPRQKPRSVLSRAGFFR
jgi:hypothetical protein